MNVGTVEVWLKLKDRFSTEFASAVKKTERSGDRLQKMGDRLTGVGAKMSVGMSVPIALFGGAAVMAFSKFDKAMTESLAIMGNVAPKMQAQMRNVARSVSEDLAVSSENAAKSFFYLASAGLDAEQSIAALPKVASFAQAGAFDMALATDLLTDAQSALGLTIRDDVVKNIESMVRVSDVLVKANALANASVEQFATSLTTKAGTSMRELNIDVESGVAVLAAWADQGVKAEMAGERFNIVTRDLQTAFINNRAEFERMNIAVYDSLGAFRPMADIVEDMEGALGEMSSEGRKATLMQLGFSDRSVQATASLLGLSDLIRKYEVGLRQAGGTTDEVANNQMKSFSNQLTVVRNKLENAFISIGESIAPSLIQFAQNVLVPMIEKLGNTAKAFMELPPPVQKFIIAMAGIAAALGPVLVVLGQFITMLGVLKLSMPGVVASLLAGKTAVLAFLAPIAPIILAAAAAGAVLAFAIKKAADESVREMGRIKRSADEAGNAFTTLRKAAAAKRGGKAVILTDAEIEGMRARRVELEQLVRQYAEQINGLEGALERGTASKRGLAAVAENLARVKGEMGAAQREIEKLRNAVHEVTISEEAMDAATAEVTGSVGTLGKTTPIVTDAMNALQESIDGLNKQLADEARILSYAEAQRQIAMSVGGGAEEFKKAEDRVAAFSAVISAGIDPMSRAGQQLVALALANIQTARAADEATAALASLVDTAIQIEQIKIKDTGIDGLLASLGKAKLDGAAKAAAQAWQDHNKALREGEEKLAAVKILMEEYGVATEATARHILGLEPALSAAAGEAAKLAQEWEEFNKNTQENFIQGVQSALATFFVEAIKGGEDAWKNLGKALKEMLINALAEWLAQFAITQAKALAIELKRIATAKAAASAAGVSGSGGGGGGGTDAAGMAAGAYKAYGSYTSAGGSTTALIAAAAVVALAVYGKWKIDKAKAETFGFGTTFGWDYARDVANVTEGASKASKAISAVMRQLLDAFQTTTGSYVTAMTAVTIMARNDGKAFSVRMGDVALGTFKTMNEAIIAAFSAAMSSAELSGSLDPAIASVLKSADQRFDTPESLMAAIELIQSLSDLGTGADEASRSINGTWQAFEQLSNTLVSMGVSAADATRLAGNALIDQLNNQRDSITGQQRTEAELRQLAEQRAVLYNANLALVRAELELRRFELEERARLLMGLAGGRPGEGGGAGGGGEGGPRPQHPTDDVDGGIESMTGAMESTGSIIGDALTGQVKMFAAWAEATTEITAGTLTAQVQMSFAAGNIVQQQLEMILRQIAAIDAILAALPEYISPGEIQIGGGKGGGVGSFGPSKAELAATLNDELDRLSDSMLPSFVGQLRDLGRWLAETSEKAAEAGVSLDRINELYEQQRALLEAAARAEVAQFTTDPRDAALQDILDWGTEMREVYEALGLALEEVEAAEQARLEALGEQMLGGLGVASVQVEQQMAQVAADLLFLAANLDTLGISTERYAEITRELGDQMFLSLADGLLRFVDNEEARQHLEQLRYTMEVAHYRLQFELLKQMGILTEQQIALIQGLLDELPTEAPTLGGSGGSGFGGGSGRDISRLNDRLESLRRAIERLRDFYEGLYADEELSPLSLGEQFANAQSHYQSVLAAALAGDEEAIAQLPDVAQQYLDLAAQMFGTAGGQYQSIFGGVVAAIEAILGEYEEPGEWFWLQTSMGTVTNKLTSSNNHLRDIRNAIVGWPGGPGGGPGGTALMMGGLAYGAANEYSLSSQVDSLHADSWVQNDRIEAALNKMASAQNRVAASNRALLTTRGAAVSGLRFRRSSAA